MKLTDGGVTFQHAVKLQMEIDRLNADIKRYRSWLGMDDEAPNNTHRVFCEKHDPINDAQWRDSNRPLLDDPCYMCKTDSLTAENARLKEENERLIDRLRIENDADGYAMVSLRSKIETLESENATLRADCKVMAEFIDKGCRTFEGIDRVRTTARKYTNKGVKKMGFRQMLRIRDLQHENDQLREYVAEMEEVLRKNNMHLLSRRCWCSPTVENYGHQEGVKHDRATYSNNTDIQRSSKNNSDISGSSY